MLGGAKSMPDSIRNYTLFILLAKHSIDMLNIALVLLEWNDY